jgi:hypothetical protein
MMETKKPLGSWTARAGALALTFLLGGTATAQEGGEQGPKPPERAGQEQEAMKKIIRLFNEVDKHLDTIDKLLYEASTRESLEESKEAIRKIDELLKAAEGDQTKAISKMDEIIVLVPRKQGGGGGGQANKPNQNPQDGEKQKPQDQGEMKNRDIRDDRPQELGQEPQNEKPSQGEPESNKESDEPGRNIEGPDKREKERILREKQRGSWEVQLPRRETDVFRNNLKDTQIPPRYHKWIERWRSLREKNKR